MSRRVLEMDRYNEIKRLLELKVPIIRICQVCKCTERTVRQIRDKGIIPPDQKALGVLSGPLWAESVDWESVLSEVLDGHPIKFIWNERVLGKVGYKGFWEQFHKRFPHYAKATSVHRPFNPGDRAEVDYAGDTINYICFKTGEIFEVPVFVGILGHSQLIYAESTQDMKSQNWILSHVRMYSFFGGVPKITVPDCLKQGVTRTHLYDPELNKSYKAMSQDFSTAIVPARPGHPKDKALAEGAVKIVMRFFRFKYRRHTFTSLEEINHGLLETINIINLKKHTRFKISRRESFESNEKLELKTLPNKPFEYAEFKTPTLHPDCHVAVESNYYSAPHRFRGRSLLVKLTSKDIEIFCPDTHQRVALHRRVYAKHGDFISDPSHLPESARAYLETTPQNILSQAKFLNSDLHQLIDGLFNENALGHLRRAQGLVREARKEIRLIGTETARQNITKAVETMKRFGKIRVPYFVELLKKARTQNVTPSASTSIERKTYQPYLRYQKKGVTTMGE